MAWDIALSLVFPSLLYMFWLHITTLEPACLHRPFLHIKYPEIIMRAFTKTTDMLCVRRAPSLPSLAAPPARPH
jgi:hypothetical protein